MLSVAPNIVFGPNITQNAERKHRMQNTNTAHFRTWWISTIEFIVCKIGGVQLSNSLSVKHRRSSTIEFIAYKTQVDFNYRIHYL